MKRLVQNRPVAVAVGTATTMAVAVIVMALAARATVAVIMAACMRPSACKHHLCTYSPPQPHTHHLSLNQ